MSADIHRLTRTQRLLWIIVGLIFLVFLFGGRIFHLYTEMLWFREVGFSEVFTTMLVAKAKMALLMGLFFFAILIANAALTHRLAPPTIRFIRGRILEIPERNIFEPYIGRFVVLAAAVLSILVATESATRWDEFLRFQNATPFGIQDPIFQKDISFYIFRLPFYSYLAQWATFVFILAILITVALYSVYGAVRLIGRATETQFQWPEVRIAPNVKEHLLVLGGLALLCKASGYWIQRYGLLYADHGLLYGAGYTDIHVRMWFLNSLIFVAIACGLLLVGNIFVRSRKALLGGVAFWVILSFAGSLIPGVVQQVSVAPNEIVREQPFIENNIKYTRMAYGLNKVESHDFPGDQSLTAADIQRNRLTLKNVRLWDHRPALATYAQLQELTTYYKFYDVDIDRYYLNGEYRQMMLSPREIYYDNLPNRTWINEHLVYTHGYGLAMSPVNQVDPKEGMPVFAIKDIDPLVSPPDISIKWTGIYYGELSNEYCFVRTSVQEFDYPRTGGKVAYTIYEGKGGVPVDSPLNRLAFAIRFNSLNILLNRSLTPESRILFHRRIPERLMRVCPFLDYDSDPYIVAADGRLYWIVDAYTTSAGYPYATPFSETGTNYIRNSVKAVVDAYNGTLWFYIFDPVDPILKTYQKIFPNLFLPREKMPKALLAHIRYPERLFKIQGAMYCRYHVEDPKVFYNQEDNWNIPQEQVFFQDQLRQADTQLMEPYYMIMRLPEETREEFILIWPFTIARKQNMAAWMCAKCDPEDYGRLIVFRFPKNKTFFGPEQIEARINSNTQISKEISLWNTQGSQVIWGNLLVIPIDRSLIYIRPLYLQSKSNAPVAAASFPFPTQPGLIPAPTPPREVQIPAIKCVVVVYGSQVVMESTLEEALERIFGNRPATPKASPPPSPTPVPPSAPAGLQNLAARAMEHYHRAEQASRQGDWAAFGSELKRLKGVLEEMNRK